MVCLYCSGETKVVNSRLQKRTNHVWRRRNCVKCGAIFSSIEHGVYDKAFLVKCSESYIIPFSRDKLFLSIYDACRHKNDACMIAGALTDTVMSELFSRHTTKSVILREEIIEKATTVLKHFDIVALTHYTAFHSAE